jgi:transcriptional regulator with XRE-family HTH domain
MKLFLTLFCSVLHMGIINKKIDDIAIKAYKGNNSAFAKVMGTSEANIRNYRKGTMPKLDFVVKLYEKFEISFEFLLFEKDSEYNLKNTEDKCSIDEEALNYKMLCSENDFLKEKLEFLNEQIEFYKSQIAFLTVQIPINKYHNEK